MPAFFVVGAAKAGTTALHNILLQHPNVFLPQMKETNYFAFQGETVDFKGPLDDQTINRFSITAAADYASLFDPAAPGQRSGEVCPSYLYIEKAAGAIFEYLPSARIIIMLRNPADRAFSNYLNLVRDGRERLSFAEALQAEEERKAAGWEWFWHLYAVGLYATQVRRYIERFGRDHVLLLLYEDFRRDPRSHIERIFRFIDVDADVLIDTSGSYNLSGRPWKPITRLYEMLLGPTALNRMLRAVMPESLRKRAGGAFKGMTTRSEVLSPAERHTLLERYEPDIARLETDTGLDCRVWREAPAGAVPR